MARGEMERRTGDEPGTLVPMYGPGSNSAPVPAGSFEAKPEWMELDTPKNPGTGFLAFTDNSWYIIMWPVRRLLVGLLAVTWRWYYVAGLLALLWFVKYLLAN